MCDTDTMSLHKITKSTTSRSETKVFISSSDASSIYQGKSKSLVCIGRSEYFYQGDKLTEWLSSSCGWTS